MTRYKKNMTILLADDDQEDRMLVEHAFKSAKTPYDLRFVQDGEELMDYLYRHERFADKAVSPRPALIILDLNIPRKNGMQALKEIRADSLLKTIPVVILTTSKDEDDIMHAYELGVNSFITKPVTYTDLVDLLMTLEKYWFSTVTLPVSKEIK
jgi:CheY-like chemotaxis protein